MGAPRPALERFNEKYIVDEATGCWLWTAALAAKTGYAKMNVGGKATLMHRWSYEHFIGPIPTGLTIDHVRARGCRHRHCVNPAHLEAVTQAENNRRASETPTHCPKGHEYTPENSYVGTQNRGRWFRRDCRACHRAQERERQHRLRAA